MYLFENDVKIYGIQTSKTSFPLDTLFENDVKIYGIQTRVDSGKPSIAFENDVKIYGIQTGKSQTMYAPGLRMM